MGTAEAVDPYRQLIRLVRCVAGEVPIRVDFEPRFDYGLTTPQLRPIDDQLAAVFGGADALVVQSDLGVHRAGLSSSGGERTLRAGDRAYAVLTYAKPHQLRAEPLELARIDHRVQATERFWVNWSRRCTYEGLYREQVLRSALVLKGLTNAPTGAIVAAPTTSLPEEIGGARNWDYRYTWLRDAAFILYALTTLGYTDESRAFIRWMERTVAGRAEDLQVLYGVGGERMLPELELPGLDGYRGSRPVRIGNAAAGQFQLDIYGEVVDTIWLYHRYGGKIGPSGWESLVRLVDYVEQRWTEPDEGIWEVRGRSAALRLLEGDGLGRRRPRDPVGPAIGAAVPDRALAPAADDDAPADRVRGGGPSQWSVRPVVRQHGGRCLGSAHPGGALRRARRSARPRHRRPDRARALRRRIRVPIQGHRRRSPGRRGRLSASARSGWSTTSPSRASIERARELFESLIAHANDVGLLAEQVDPASGEQLGNFPQAFSHMGLINSAIQLQSAP